MLGSQLKKLKDLAECNCQNRKTLEENNKLIAELEKVNKELAKKNSDCVELTENLRLANLQVRSEFTELEKITKELLNIKLERKVDKVENEKRNLELIISYKALKTSEEYERYFVRALAEMMYLTSHKVRRPVTNIIGISGILDQSLNSPEKLKRIIEYIKHSAVTLDVFTKELSAFMTTLEKKVNYKKRK